MLAIQAARFLCAILAGVMLAESPTPQAECPLPEFMSRADIPGLGLAEVRSERIDVSVYGYAESPAACVTNNTVFEAASLTKPVVAYAVMRLVDQGRFDLDDSLVELLPSLPLPPDDARSARVTVRMVLAHSSGLDGPDDRMLSFVAEPGEVFEYYPAGYRLVQRVVEHIEGDSLEVIAKREVFEPLGMASSSLVFREDLLERIATRHRMLGDPIERKRNPDRPANAAASLITSPEDYGRFLRAMLTGDGLSAQSHRAMLSPQIEVPETGGAVAWGVGWGLEPGRGTFFHWGDDGSAKSFTMGSEADEQAIVYFANSYYGMAIAQEMAEWVLPGRAPGVDWLGYSSWDSPKRLVRLETVRAFVEGDADLGMATFERYAREHPDLDMENHARFITWILDGRGRHEGRAHLLEWQIRRDAENLDLYLDLARSQRALDADDAAIETLRRALRAADDSTRESIESRIGWIQDDLLSKSGEGRGPEPEFESVIGRYGDWRVLSAEEGLVFKPQAETSYRLRWMHGTLYALDELDWFRLRLVVQDGRATKAIGLYEDGRVTEYARTEDLE